MCFCASVTAFVRLSLFAGTSSLEGYSRGDLDRLKLAIANGDTWHPMGCRNNGGSESVGLLQLLWEHSPEQALEKDPVTSLYPFMLAATTYSGHEDTGRLERDRDVVDTVYSLLRKAPQLIGDGLASRGR